MFMSDGISGVLVKVRLEGEVMSLVDVLVSLRCFDVADGRF